MQGRRQRGARPSRRPVASFPPVEAAVRLLRLLEALNRQPVATIAQLHGETGLPKPSIVRLLQTLEGCGYVKHAPRPGAYLLTAKVRGLASGYHGEPRIVEVVAPLLDALTAQIKWPAALAVPDAAAAALVVRYSTIPTSPLALLHSTVGMRLSLVTRALGRAYLAFCDGVEREALIGLAAASGETEDDGARQRASLDATLELVRRQGYALRDPAVRPVSRTLAVPVFEGTRAVAAIGITWFASTMNADEAVHRHLGALLALARQAGQALSAADGPPSAAQSGSGAAAA